MKKPTILLFLLLLSSVVQAQNSEFVPDTKQTLNKLFFEVEMSRNTFLPLEPLTVRFKISNRTKAPLAIERPQFLLDSRLKITDTKGNLIKEIDNLITSQGRALPLPGSRFVLQPLQSYEEETIPALNPITFLEPGKYKLQFIFFGGIKTIESNVVEINIEKPEGLDKEAFDFLDEYGKDIWFGKYLEKGDVDVLKEFVNQYGESSYGKYAIKSLANYYFSNGDLDKAKIEFERIKSSNNKFIAEVANKSLAEIEKKKREMEK